MRKYRKPYRIKKKGSILKGKFFWLGILVFAAVVGIFYFICFFSFFQIKEIKISGNSAFAEASADKQKVSIEDIRNVIEKEVEQKFLFLPSKSIFLINLNEINKMVLEEFPQAAKVNLKREFPDTILIEIEERKPAAIFCQGENCFFIDKEGIIFEGIVEVKSRQGEESKLSSSPFATARQGEESKLSSSPIATAREGEESKLSSSPFATARELVIRSPALLKESKLGEKVIEKELLNQILEIESKIKNELKIPINEVLIVLEERLNVKTLEGWEIYFNPQKDINWQLTKLRAVLEEEIPPEKRKDLEYIELRFGNFANPKYRQLPESQ